MYSDPKVKRSLFLAMTDMGRQAVQKQEIKPMKSAIIGVSSYASQMFVATPINSAIRGLIPGDEEGIGYAIDLLSEAISIAGVMTLMEMGGLVSENNVEMEGSTQSGTFMKSLALVSVDLFGAEALSYIMGGAYPSGVSSTTVTAKTGSVSAAPKTTITTTPVKSSYVK